MTTIDRVISLNQAQTAVGHAPRTDDRLHDVHDLGAMQRIVDDYRHDVSRHCCGWWELLECWVTQQRRTPLSAEQVQDMLDWSAWGQYDVREHGQRVRFLEEYQRPTWTDRLNAQWQAVRDLHDRLTQEAELAALLEPMNPTDPQIDLLAWFQRTDIDQAEKAIAFAELVATKAKAEAEAERLAQELQVSRERHASDIETISDGMIAEANRRDWCEDYDRIVERFNESLNVPMTHRQTTQDYDVTMTVSVTVTYSGNHRNEDDAADVVQTQIQNFLSRGYFHNCSYSYDIEETDVSVAY